MTAVQARWSDQALLEWTDLFAGAGGSTSGVLKVASAAVRIAANHNGLAVAVHQANHPTTDHALVDLHQENPAFFPRTRFLWASPECTRWSQGASMPMPAIEKGLFEDPNSDEAATRSRLLMFDVLRFAEHHRYEVMVIENVVDIAVQSKYRLAWRVWQDQLRALGYSYRVMSLNSAHAQLAGAPAPQSRDRLYVVAWLPSAPRLDLDQLVRPRAYCSRCDRFVQAHQSWKAGRAVGRYRQSYVYVDPSCGTVVEPGWLPASAAIDPTLTGAVIGDQYVPKTRDRVAAGIARYWIQADGSTTEQDLVVPVEGRAGKDADPALFPLRTLTTRAETALVTRHYGSVGGAPARHTTPADEPLRTLTCSGGNMSITRPPEGFIDGARPVTEQLTTMTADGNHHGLVLPYYSSDRTHASTTQDLLGTLTTVDRFALVDHRPDGAAAAATTPELIYLRTPRGPRAKVTQEQLEAAHKLVPHCTLRMLQPHEGAAGQGFDPDYDWDASTPDEPTTKRRVVRMIGNAVSPPVARDISTVIHTAYETA